MTFRQIAIYTSILIAIIAGSIGIGSAQPGRDEDNLLRAERLLPILLEAESIDDPAMRVLIRFECLEFIYGHRLPTLHDRSDSEVFKFYAQLTAEKRPVRYRVNDWQNGLLTLLRKNRPNLAKQIEATYLKDEDISPTEIREILDNGNIHAAVERMIDRMRREAPIASLSWIEELIRKRNPGEADRLIGAAFEASEKPGSTWLPILGLLWNRPPEFFEKWSPHLRTRYLRLIIDTVRSNAHAGNDSLTRMAKAAMDRNYENYVKFAPEMIAEVEELSRPPARGTSNVDDHAARRRIETSVDRVKQALLEADAVSDNDAKYRLLSQAMTYAGQTEQFTRAVEIADSARKYTAQASTIVDWDLWNRVLPSAPSNKHLEAANLIISKIYSDIAKAGALADLARVQARANRKEEAVKLVKQAYQLLEKKPSAAVPASVIFHLVDPAFIAESAEGFDAARRSITLANRLPEPTPNEKVGANGYQSYADGVLIPIGINIGGTFKWMASKDIAIAEAREPDLKYRSWRLLARIAIEKNRPYPQRTQ